MPRVDQWHLKKSFTKIQSFSVQSHRVAQRTTDIFASFKSLVKLVHIKSVTVIITLFVAQMAVNAVGRQVPVKDDRKKEDRSSQSDLELLCAFARLQTDDDVADGFSVATHGILRLTGGQLSHLSFIHLLCFFDTQPWMWATLNTHAHTHTK